jgi:hypothetical protein
MIFTLQNMKSNIHSAQVSAHSPPIPLPITTKYHSTIGNNIGMGRSSNQSYDSTSSQHSHLSYFGGEHLSFVVYIMLSLLLFILYYSTFHLFGKIKLHNFIMLVFSA